jgi:outer membrane usher protein
MFLSITLNMEHKGEYMVMMTRTGDFLIKADDLKAMGLKELSGQTTEIDGEAYLSLRSMDEMKFVFDEKKLTLDISAPPRLLPQKTIDFMPQRQTKVYYPKDNSVFLNYGLNYFETGPRGTHSTGLANELGFRTGELLFLSDSSYTKDQTEEKFARLSSNVTYDRRSELQRITAGDFFASSGDLGSSVNLGGLSFSKIYSIDPYFIKNPYLDFSGVVSVPSQADIYLNGMKIRTEKLSPGEFHLSNLQSYGGPALVEIVIKDPYGREQRLKYSSYYTDILLRKGLHEYSYNAGFLREGLGTQSDQYGDFAYSFFHKYGFTDALMLGFRGEGTRGLYNIGSQGSFLAGNAGVISMAISGSSDELQGDGYAGTVTYGYQGRKINGNFFLNEFSRQYTTLANRSIPGRAKYDVGTGIGYFSESLGSFSLDLTASKKYAEREITTARTTYSKNLSRDISVFATFGRTMNDVESYDFFIGLNYYSGKDTGFAVRYDQSDAAKTETVQVQKNQPAGEGLGYSATVAGSEASSGGNFSINPSLQYNSRYNIFRGDFNRRYDGDAASDTAQIFVSGAVVYLGNVLGFTRPVTDSFGLVKIGDLEGVRVYNSNQEIGRTNSSGTAFVPNMGSYYDNMISINDKDIPMDYSLSGVAQYVSPPLRSGSCIVFGARRLQYITGMLKMRSGNTLEPVEFAEVTMKVGDKEITFPTGRGGEFSFDTAMQEEHVQPEHKDCTSLKKREDALAIKPGTYRTLFEHKGQTCTFNLVIPDAKDTIVDLGDVVCGDGKS